jgi:hypothetical protein
MKSFGWQDDPAGRRAYQRLMQKRVTEISVSVSPHEADAQWADIRRGWCFGGEAFRQDMMDKLDDVIGEKGHRDSFSGQEVRLHDEAAAERLVCESLARLKLKEADVPLLPKGADEKKAVISLLKMRTHVSNKWIVKRLYAGHPANIPRYIADVKTAKPGSRFSGLVRMLECED